MAKEIKARFAQKIDTYENWLKATSFIPASGEIIIVSNYNNLILSGNGNQSAATIVAAAIQDLPIHRSEAEELIQEYVNEAILGGKW